MAVVDVDKLVAVREARNVEIEFLGQLLWYSIPEMAVSRADLERTFAEAGLDPSHLPKPINARDAFRRASKAGELTGHVVGQDRNLNLLVREVYADHTCLIRHLVREIVDGHNQRLEYTPVAALTLDGDVLKVNPLAVMEPVEQEQIAKIRLEYDRAREHYEADVIRNTLRSVLSTCSPVAVRPSGGVYFTPRSAEPTVTALKKWVASLEPFVTSGTGVKPSMYTVPVIDAAEHRAMVEESVEDQVKAMAESLINRMATDLRKGRTVTQKMAEGYIQEVRELKRMVAEYEELLQTQIQTAHANLEVTMAQAMKLLEMVEPS